MRIDFISAQLQRNSFSDYFDLVVSAFCYRATRKE